jgi:hypothetical protein
MKTYIYLVFLIGALLADIGQTIAQVQNDALNLLDVVAQTYQSSNYLIVGSLRKNRPSNYTIEYFYFTAITQPDKVKSVLHNEIMRLAVISDAYKTWYINSYPQRNEFTSIRMILPLLIVPSYPTNGSPSGSVRRRL